MFARDAHVQQDPHQRECHVHEGERADLEVQDVETHGHDGRGGCIPEVHEEGVGGGLGLVLGLPAGGEEERLP